MDYLALILPLTNYGTMGFAFNYLHMGEMEVTTTKDPEGTGEKFNASSYIGQFSYGVNLTDRFSLGYPLSTSEKLYGILMQRELQLTLALYLEPKLKD